MIARIQKIREIKTTVMLVEHTSGSSWDSATGWPYSISAGRSPKDLCSSKPGPGSDTTYLGTKHYAADRS
jgi:hypothetical protein